MENSGLKSRVFKEVQNLVSSSCYSLETSKKHQILHEMIVKKHYNAVDITIDYHRNRILMDLVVDDSSYDPENLTFSTPLMRTNMYYDNLKGFLLSCLETDNASIAFYANLLKTFRNSKKKEVIMA